METYVIHVTKECNLNCLYCYEQDKSSKYSWDEIKEFIDKLIEYRTSDEFNIEFLGGEPMLAWEYIKKSYEYLESTPGINVRRYIITTNGTVITPESADYISKNKKMIFAISMDGHLHSNQLRIFKNTHINSYNKVMDTIEFIKDYNIIPHIHIVTHPYNVGMLYDSIVHLYNKGIRHIDVGIVEKSLPIDDNFCRRMIYEMMLISDKIIDKTYPDLVIGSLEFLKPVSDVRTYIKDKNTGKIVAETYGRSGNDVSVDNDDYEIIKCYSKDETSSMIEDIRQQIYRYYQTGINK